MTGARPSVFFASAALLIAATTDARADDIEQCATAATRGQHQEQAAKLKDARASFLECARPACPLQVRDVCDSLLSKVEESLPTIILGARRADGQDVVAASAQIDGAPFASTLDGKAIEIDPGPHTLRIDAGTVIERQIVVREGEKNRAIVVDLPAPPAPAAAPVETKRGRRIAAFVTGGIGLASLAGFGALDAYGQFKFGSCEGNRCSSSTVSALTATRIVDYALLGVGVVGVGASATLFLTSRSTPTTVQATFVPVPGAERFVLKGTF